MRQQVFTTLFLVLGLTTALPEPVTWDHLVKRACSAATQQRVAAGQKSIQANIGIQKQEVKNLQGVAKSDPGLKSSSSNRKPHGKRSDDDAAELLSDLEKRRLADTFTFIHGVDQENNNHLESRGEIKMSPLEARAGSSTSNFQNSKAKLANTINQGVAQRKISQSTLPKNSPAQPGLNKVANAQSQEKQLASSLDGTSKDRQTIKTLNTDFHNGINQNKANYKAAGSQCRRDLEQLQWIRDNMPQFMSM